MDSVFTQSAGADEGALIRDLVATMFRTSAPEDLFTVIATVDECLCGAGIFSRLDFGTDDDVFILGPMAVSSERQRQGIGTNLISYGLQRLANNHVKGVLTYGDPAFYGKVGFRSISPALIRPPFELSQPVGWLGQSLEHDFIESLSGVCTCVEALNNPVYW